MKQTSCVKNREFTRKDVIVMLLTKERALELHRDMWLWISREIAKYKSILVINMLEEEYIENYCNDVSIDNNCFTCEYAGQKAKEKYKNEYCAAHHRCKFCPLEWGTSGDEEGRYMCELNNNKSSDETGLYARCCNIGINDSNKNSWKKQAKLAYKIAMLPEKE